jgi:hypothetical protein
MWQEQRSSRLTATSKADSGEDPALGLTWSGPTKAEKCSDNFGHSNCVFLRESDKVVKRRFYLYSKVWRYAEFLAAAMGKHHFDASEATSFWKRGSFRSGSNIGIEP